MYEYGLYTERSGVAADESIFWSRIYCIDFGVRSFTAGAVDALMGSFMGQEGPAYHVIFIPLRTIVFALVTALKTVSWAYCYVIVYKD